MTRQILALQKDAYYYILDCIPKAIKSESIDEQHQIIDIELADAAILKVYENEIVIDMGAKKVMLEAQDFNEILIR